MHDDNPVDRRRFMRVLFDAQATLTTPQASFVAPLIDISLNGALTRRPAGWEAELGSQVSLTVSLDAAAARIQMQARLAHAEDDQIGFLCEQIDMDSITHLRRLVELNLGDAKLLERELEALG